MRVVEWFGYKLHLVCDTRHEVALAYTVTPASGPDREALPELVRPAKVNCLPNGATRWPTTKLMPTGVHRRLAAEGIRQVIQTRSLWREEGERVLEGAGFRNGVHDKAGTIYGYDQKSDSPVRHRMASLRHEPARGTLQYRCPAEHQGWRCPCRGRCNDGQRYGTTVQVKQELDLATVFAGATGDQTLRAALQGSNGDGAGTGAVEGLLGDGRRAPGQGANFLARLGLGMAVPMGLATLLATAPRREPGPWRVCA